MISSSAEQLLRCSEKGRIKEEAGKMNELAKEGCEIAITKEFILKGLPVIASLEPYYTLGPTIGRGEFAKVKVARSVQTGQQVAIKFIKIFEDFGDCANDRLKLNHPNIVKLHEVFRLPDSLAIVMEYAAGGELFEHVQKKGLMNNVEVKAIMHQIFTAVDYLHSKNITHRDLKLENILLCEDGRVVITDFGFSKSFIAGKMLTTACGSPCYAAPELVLGKTGYDASKADVWSCGVIMYALAFGHLPFEGELSLERPEGAGLTWTPTNVFQLYHYILEHPITFPTGLVDGLEGAGIDFLAEILDVEPETRLTISEILHHPWFQEYAEDDRDNGDVDEGHVHE